MPLVSARYLAMESTLRVVPRRLTSWATGIQLLLFNLIGSLPGPLIYGSILDKACLVQQNEGVGGGGGEDGGSDGGGGGACVIYDKAKLGDGMFNISFPMKFAAAVFVFAAWRLQTREETKKKTPTETS